MSIRERLIYLPPLLMDMGTSSAMLAVPFLAISLGASSLVIGAMASVSTLLYSVFCQVFGKLSDRVNRKRFPQVACVCFSVLCFVVPRCRSLYQLVFLFPFFGITLSALWPALEAWIGERKDDWPLMKRLRIFNLSWTSGVMIGYFVAGQMYGLHIFAPFYFASVLGLCAFLVISVQPNSEGRSANGSADQPPQAGGCEPETSQPQVARYLYLSWSANFVSWLALGVVRYILPKLIVQMGMTAGAFGLLMLCLASARWLMFLILGATKRWHYKFAPLAAFQVLASFAFVTIWLTNSPGLWALALALFGLNTAMTYFSSMYYSLCGHSDLGSKTGWHESILSSGALVGPFIGGALAHFVSLKSPYLFCAAATLIGLPVQLFFLRGSKRLKER